MGFPAQHRPAAALCCRQVLTSRLLFPFSVAGALLCTQALPARAGPVGKCFSHLCATLHSYSLGGRYTRPFPTEPVWPVCLTTENIPAVCARWKRGLHGFPLAFDSSTGKSSPHGIAAADGTLFFPHMPSAVRFRVSGGFKKGGGGGN